MSRPERTTRIVITVTHDADEPCPVDVGSSQGLVLATWLAGAEVKVADVGPALRSGERERGPALLVIERTIGSILEAQNRNVRVRRTYDQGLRNGLLQGLATAYRALTGLPQATAERIGRDVWSTRDREEASG